jgi:hypothetical protein
MTDTTTIKGWRAALVVLGLATTFGCTTVDGMPSLRASS